MSSQSVVQGDREPVQSRGYAPENGDDVNMPTRSSTDQLAQNDNPRTASTEIATRPSNSRIGSRAQRTRGSPSQPNRRDDSRLQAQPAGFVDVLRQTLKSDEMTSRACRLMITLAMSLAIVLIPLAAVAFIVMVKAPVDWKVILGAGSTIFISFGSLFFGHRRATRKSKRSLITDSSEDPTQDN